MWENTFAKEPFDCRLMILRLFQKIWIPVLGALAGALLLGGGYWLWNEVIAGDKLYTITSTYDVLYGEDPQTGFRYTYINNHTWNTWMDTDHFQEKIVGRLAEEGITLTKEQLADYLAADLPSDLEIPITIVTTPDKELTEQLNRAVQAAMVDFGEERIEIVRLNVVDTGVTLLVDNSPRTVQASILGAVAGTLFVLFMMFIRFCLKEAVWVPETFTFRFGIPAIGLIAAEEEKLSEEDCENLRSLFGGRKRIAVTAWDPQLDLNAAKEALPKTEGCEYVCIPSMEQVPQAAGLLREADGVLLVVEAGESCGRNIMHLLHNMKIQDISVTGALLWNGDRKLLKAYYKMPL